MGDEIFDDLLSYDKKDYLLCCTISHSTKHEKSYLRNLGLRHGHAYTVLGAHKLNSRGGTVRLVEIRNPHGQGQSEWQGKWSDNCPNWTSELKERCKWTNEEVNDGRFFMSAEDFCEYFSYYDICKYGEPSERMPRHCPKCKGTGKNRTGRITGTKFLLFYQEMKISTKICPCQVIPLKPNMS